MFIVVLDYQNLAQNAEKVAHRKILYIRDHGGVLIVCKDFTKS